jgi:hypothetical protein
MSAGSNGVSANQFINIAANHAILKDSSISNNLNVVNKTYTSARLGNTYSIGHINENPLTPYIVFLLVLD